MPLNKETKLNIKSVLYDYMCILPQYFMGSTNTQETGNVILRAVFSLF